MTEHIITYEFLDKQVPPDLALTQYIDQMVRPGDSLTIDGNWPVDPETNEAGYTVEGLEGNTVDLTHAVFWREELRETERYGYPAFQFMDCRDIEAVGGRVKDCNDTWRSALRARLIRQATSERPAVWGNFEPFPSFRVVRCLGLNWAEAVANDSPSDFLTIAGHCERLHFLDWRCETAGRHGVAFRDVDELTFEGMDMRRIRRIRYDHEPTPTEGVTKLSIVRDRGHSGRIAPSYLQLAAVGGKRGPSRLSEVLLDDVMMDEGHIKILVQTGGAQRDSFTMRDVVSTDAEFAQLGPGDWLVQVGGVSGLAAGFDEVIIDGLRDSLTANAEAKGRGIKLSPNTGEAIITNVDFNPWGLR